MDMKEFLQKEVREGRFLAKAFLALVGDLRGLLEEFLREKVLEFPFFTTIFLGLLGFLGGWVLFSTVVAEPTWLETLVVLFLTVSPAVVGLMIDIGLGAQPRAVVTWLMGHPLACLGMLVGVTLGLFGVSEGTPLWGIVFSVTMMVAAAGFAGCFMDETRLKAVGVIFPVSAFIGLGLGASAGALVAGAAVLWLGGHGTWPGLVFFSALTGFIGAYFFGLRDFCDNANGNAVA